MLLILAWLAIAASELRTALQTFLHYREAAYQTTNSNVYEQGTGINCYQTPRHRVQQCNEAEGLNSTLHELREQLRALLTQKIYLPVTSRFSVKPPDVVEAPLHHVQHSPGFAFVPFGLATFIGATPTTFNPAHFYSAEVRGGRRYQTERSE
ncbi:hypothetical protein CLOP_g3583 [Closterium sp. NIES-67]|nr:hypothetical protein CLOP_g3583 [Closterium sp. NIES-67]